MGVCGAHERETQQNGSSHMVSASNCEISTFFLLFVKNFTHYLSNSKLYAIGGYDGICNLSSVECYDSDKDQWTMVSPMCAHEGVVGVGVLPNDVDSLHVSNHQQQQSARKDSSAENAARSQQILSASAQAPFSATSKPLLNSYYSLMEEEEEDENQYSTLISPNAMNQAQPQHSHPQQRNNNNS